ncbi:MAG: hypothetical protein O3C40_24980 [Planctomycetota bacterium]|nr:hypothetical protein [Planctomycetota bacterium]
MTPYTSLLVLETDKDRERFGVQRRYQIRDGERFFADGRDNAAFELLQQQMKRAGDWRLNLRRQILRGLAGLGRDSNLLQQLPQAISELSLLDSSGRMSRPVAYGGFAVNETLAFHDRRGGFASGFDGRMPASGSINFNTYDGADFLNLKSAVDGTIDEIASAGSWDIDNERDGADAEWLDKNFNGVMDFESSFEMSELLEAKELFSAVPMQASRRREFASVDLDGYAASARAYPSFFRRQALEKGKSLPRGMRTYYEGGYDPHQYTGWVNALFPVVPATPGEPQMVESDWPDDAVAISQSLVQPIAIDAGGIAVRRRTLSCDPRWDRSTGESERVELFSPQQWLHFTDVAGSDTHVEWCDQEQRGIYSQAFQLGRQRKSRARDLSSFTPGQRAFGTQPLHETHRQYRVEVERPADDRIVLVLSYPKAEPTTELRIEIDAENGVVTRSVSRHLGKVTASTNYEDYVQVAGVWWPGKIETFDTEGRRTSLTTQRVKALAPDAFDQRFAEESPDREQTLVLDFPWPTVRKAEIAATDGSAAVEHRLTLLLRAMTIQKWDEAFQQLGEFEKLAAGKPGLVWIRTAIEIAARKNEEARQRLTQQAEQLAANARGNEFYLANYVLDQVGQISDMNERLQLLDTLLPVFERQPATTLRMRIWQAHRAGLLQSVGRVEESQALRRELATEAAWDVAAQTQYAIELAAAGDHKAAWVWLRQEIARKEHNESESQQLRNQYAAMLREQGRDDELVTFCEEWIATEPSDYGIFQQYLHALSMADRDDEADAKVREWLVAGRIDGLLDPATLAKINAASSYARGQRYQTYMNWIDPAWLQPLQDTARFFLTHEHQFYLASSIIDDGHFNNSDESDRLRAEIAQRLVAEAGKLDGRRLASYVRWCVGRKDVTPDEWQAIAATVRARWEDEVDKTVRQTLAGVLVQIYSTYFRDNDHLPFLRARVARAEQDEDAALTASFVTALFNELLQREWREEYEVEAFSLIERLSASPLASQQLSTQIGALHQFVDAMLQSRYQATMRAFQDAGHPEGLTRTEVAAKQAEFQQAARQGSAERLSQAAAELANAELKPWVDAELQFLDLRLDRHHEQVAEACWEILGETPQPENVDDDLEHDAAGEAWRLEELRGMLRDRAYATLNYLAVRRSAPQGLVERLLKYVAAGTQFEGDAAAIWKDRRFALLVALDRPDELERELREWIRTDVPLPTELDENVLFAFRALFEKSNSPGNYADELRQFYTACRDFRLLQMIPDALTGRTPQQVYPFLESLRSSVLYEIRKEATADELLLRLKAVREKSESAIDRRALDLLEVLIERQAAAVLNQPGPHVDAAVAALERAFEHEWAEGEVRQVASVLSGRGTIKHEQLNAERMRQLRALRQMTEPGTDDRCYVSWYLAAALFHSADDRPAGLAMAENALREIAPAYPNGWPGHLNTPLDGCLSLLETAGQFAAGEALLDEQIAKPLNEQQKYWLGQRKNRLYERALRDGGRVSLGAGETLFLNLETHLLAQAETNDDNHRREVVSLLIQVYRTAKNKNIAAFEKQLRTFVFELLEPILKRQTNNYRDLVQQTAQAVRELLGPRDALALLIDRFENYPRRFEYTYESPWQQFAYQLAQWHHESVGTVGDLEPRLLAIVLKELQRDLRNRSGRSRYLYHDDYGSHFWKEKAADFALAAEAVLEERGESGRSVAYIADYLYGGLDKHERAIEILLIAHQKKLLDTGPQITLGDYLHQQKRYAESIPILEPIVEADPDVMAYRTRLITAYGRSSREEPMRTLAAATDEHFRQAGRWTESNIAQLAESDQVRAGRASRHAPLRNCGQTNSWTAIWEGEAPAEPFPVWLGRSLTLTC